MADERSAGFFFNVQKWRGSKSVQRMSFSERGVYLEMMLEQWEKRSLPDSAQAVADQLATLPGHAAEVISGWEKVRAKFEPTGKDGRLINPALERTRREQAKYYRDKQTAGRRGGIAAAQKRHTDKDLSASSATAEPSSAVGHSSEKTRQEKTRQEEIGNAPVPRAHRGTVFDGALPREHRDHIFCDDTFSICVPPAVHAKFMSPASRKFGGDRVQTHEALKTWYHDIARALPPDFVMGDAFKFWQPRFDAAFASADPAALTARRQAAEPSSTVPTVAETRRLRALDQEPHR